MFLSGKAGEGSVEMGRIPDYPVIKLIIPGEGNFLNLKGCFGQENRLFQRNSCYGYGSFAAMLYFDYIFQPW